MIYLFNQTEELIDVIDEASLAEFTHTIELNQFDRASFEVPVDYKPKIIKEAQFFGFQSRDRAFCLFRISEKSYDIGLTIQGIDRAESDLHSFIIEDKRPGGNASDVLREILKGTGYQLGNVDGLTINGNMSFYYISVRQALVKLIESYACEFKVRYTFVENKIIGRYIDLNQRFGRKTGHQFEYGSNILNITYEESSDEVVTALIGRGKGEQSTDESGEATGGYGRRIQFKDVVWSVSKGDPVDKPAGQNYVANETARNIYGLHQNGEIKHRFGVYTNEDIEDPVELLKATYKELQRLSVPIVTFKANLLDLANAIEQDVWIGDSVGIVRDQIGIAFEARIHKLIIDKLDDNRSVVELGDYQTLQAKDRSTRQQAIKEAVSGFSEGLIEEAIANEVERRNKEFDEKIRVNKLEFDNELQRAKERAEEVKRQISDEIDKKFQSFDNAAINEARRKAEEALRSAGASSSLAQEAKRISLDSIAKLEAFKSQATSAQTALSGDLDALKRTVTSEVNQASEYRRTTTEALSRMTGQMNGFATKSEVRQDVAGLTETFAKLKSDTNNLISGAKSEITLAKTEFKKTADGLSAKMSAVESYVGQDGQRQEALRRYTREESARQATAVREQISRDYVGKNTFQESVQGVERRLESLSLGTSGNLLKNSNDGFRNQNDKKYRLVETLQANQVYTLVSKYWHGENATGHTFLDGIGNWRHLTYNSAIDAWMVQFTPTQKIPAGTEITLSSDPGGSVGNMSWATLVRGAIPLIHWQPAKGDVEEGVTQKLAEYKETVDGRFATISSQINGKVNQADFQRVKETSQLYERIIGSNENDISNKVARMVMTSQLFQVEVSKNEGLKTVQRQLAGSWSVQNLTSAGSIVSQINATNNQILIEAEKIRLKGKTLLDELTAIQGYFKRLFVGEGAFAKLNAEIIGSKTITADKLIMDQAMARMFVSSNIFTDMLAAKEAFINKLRSVVVTATLLEGYKGKIGGFQIGTHEKDPNSYWLTGLNQFKVGMSNGQGRQFQTAFWANWGNDWGKPGPLSWYVTLEGKMYCNNDAAFHRVVDFSSKSVVNFYGSNSFHKNIEMKGGTEIYGTGRSPRENGKNAVVWWNQVGDGTVKYWIDRVSDRRLKRDIIDTDVNAINKINQLKMVAFDFIKTGKHEEIGLIAQEVEAILPSAISQNPENPDGYLHIDYTAFVPYLIKAIQELNKKLEEIA